MTRRKSIRWGIVILVAAAAFIAFGFASRQRSIAEGYWVAARVRELVPKVTRDCKLSNCPLGSLYTAGKSIVNMPESVEEILKLGPRAEEPLNEIIAISINSPDPDVELAGDVAVNCRNLINAANIERGDARRDEKSGVMLRQYSYSGNRPPTPREQIWRLLKSVVPKSWR